MGSLVEYFLKHDEVTLFYKRYNDGTEEVPDVIIDNLYAEVKQIHGGTQKNILFYLSKENDKSVFSAHEMYKMPFTDDKYVLAHMFDKVQDAEVDL